ncbi:hypothetical protein BH11PSE11_BH11PSE11_27780 [soil metagenome]
MAIINTPTQGKTTCAVKQESPVLPDISVHLWRALAEELDSLIGEGGVQSLFSKSLHVTRARFPWLPAGRPGQTIHASFEDLQLCFAGRAASVIAEANVALLTTFIDILTSLVGKQITTSIMRAAWGELPAAGPA